MEPFSETYARFPQWVKALSELRTYIVNNRHLIPNYGERYRQGEAIATGFAESTVNEVAAILILEINWYRAVVGSQAPGS